jgi:hypothetical protein
MGRGLAVINHIAISYSEWMDAFRLTPQTDGLFRMASGEDMRPLSTERNRSFRPRVSVRPRRVPAHLSPPAMDDAPFRPC